MCRYDADKRIANVLTGLGFKQSDWTKLCSEFSGGWQVKEGGFGAHAVIAPWAAGIMQPQAQMRIALARLLLGPAGQSAASAAGSAGVLFLDEPTNHLDRAACRWLGTFLQTSSGGDGRECGHAVRKPTSRHAGTSALGSA